MDCLTGEYRPLNRRQLELLRELRGLQDRQIIQVMGSISLKTEHLDKKAARQLMEELEAIGYLKFTRGRNDAITEFTLSSAARDYEWVRFWHFARVAALKLVDIGAGCAGGLVVWCLTRLFG